MLENSQQRVEAWVRCLHVTPILAVLPAAWTGIQLQTQRPEHREVAGSPGPGFQTSPHPFLLLWPQVLSAASQSLSFHLAVSPGRPRGWKGQGRQPCGGQLRCCLSARFKRNWARSPQGKCLRGSQRSGFSGPNCSSLASPGGHVPCPLGWHGADG